MVVIRRCWYHDDGMILIFLAMYHVHVFVSNLKPQMLFIFTSCAMKFCGYLDHHPWIEMFRTATHFVVQYSSFVFPLLCGCFNLQYIPQDKHVVLPLFQFDLTDLTFLFVFGTATTTTLWYIILHAMYVWYMYTVYKCMIYVSMIYYIAMIYIQYTSSSVVSSSGGGTKATNQHLHWAGDSHGRGPETQSSDAPRSY